MINRDEMIKISNDRKLGLITRQKQMMLGGIERELRESDNLNHLMFYVPTYVDEDIKEEVVNEVIHDLINIYDFDAKYFSYEPATSMEPMDYGTPEHILIEW